MKINKGKIFILFFIIIVPIIGCQRFSPLIDKWELVSVNNPPFGGVASEIEYFPDGTGRMFVNILGGYTEAFTWSTEGGRLRHENFGILQIYEYEISGSTITYHYNRATNSYSVYRRIR